MNYALIVEQRGDLLSALEALIGSNDVVELENMAKILHMVADNEDAAASLNAIRVLIKVKKASEDPK